MARYDRQWGWRADPREGFGPRAGRYGEGYGGWGERWGQSWERGYDRGLYGGAYPQFGGYPGGRPRGMYYGGRPPGPAYEGELDRWGPAFGRRGGYQGGYDEGYGWQGGYAREPFLPPEAYRRHAELDEPRRHGSGRWPEHGHDLSDGVGMEDDEIRQAVRQSLFQDNWLEADRIDVEVNGGVVMLTGEVHDYLEARYAWDDAWETPGVRGVVNQITVRADEPQTEKDAPASPAAAKRKSGGTGKKAGS